MKSPRITLEQWRVLQAVVDHGGYARAARALHRSQSSLSYTVKRMQHQLGVALLRMEGRKAVLTETGEVMLRRSRQLLRDARTMEALARQMEQGWEAELRLVVDETFPSALLMQVLGDFDPISRGSRIVLLHAVKNGTMEELDRGAVDLAIAYQLPRGFCGSPLLGFDYIAVAHPEHPLHRLGHELSTFELRQQRQVVVRDSGLTQRRDPGWLDAELRWSVSNLETAITTISHGLGFGWLPAHAIAGPIGRGELKPLPLRDGAHYRGQLYLVYGREEPGSAACTLATLFQRAASGFAS
ncbi:MAG TPA: LysR family transcriptional regulator [Gammaproteobacteria bacterium]|jgi:DNA-binding transcriptional LysR family regulator